MPTPWWRLPLDRRRGDRRRSDRRAKRRGGPERRRGDRRAATRALLFSVASVALLPNPAKADVFTRRGQKGVLEATNIPDREGFQLAYRSKGEVIHSPEFLLRPSNNRRYDAFIQEASSAHGVDETLIRAVIQVESQFDAGATSRKGARGLMQIMPSTAERLGVYDPFDPRQNIFGGVKYLRMLLDMFNGDVSLAVAGYNAGEHAVQRHNGVPPYKETQGYVRKILGLLGRRETAVASRAESNHRVAAVKPSVIYKWRDAQGRLFLSDTPPPSQIPFVVVTRQGD